MSERATQLDVIQLPDGPLTVGHWAGVGEPVIALHGLGGNHAEWSVLAEATQSPLIAPDLRGRGASQNLPSSRGIDSHVRDVLAVADFYRLKSFAVAGVSMGAYIATGVAARAPDRTTRVVLIDGGLPVPPAGGETRGQLPAMVAARTAFNRRSFASADEIVGRVRGMLPETDRYWSCTHDRMLTYGLERGQDGWRREQDLDSIAADIDDCFFTGAAERHLRAVRAPITLFHAEYGPVTGTPPLNPTVLVDTLGASVREGGTSFQSHHLRGATHLSLLLAPETVAVISAAIGSLSVASPEAVSPHA